jgi:hypothetical protein
MASPVSATISPPKPCAVSRSLRMFLRLREERSARKASKPAYPRFSQWNCWVTRWRRPIRAPASASSPVQKVTWTEESRFSAAS